jgi:pimeloyl-ACP methyl ester carboxylesterase
VHLPHATIEKYTNLKQYTVMPSGGHFAAAEKPELTAEDIQKFFRKLR